MEASKIIQDIRDMQERIKKEVGYQSVPLPRIITDPNFTKQFRFPKTKKKRIRKKWYKDSKNHKPDTENFLCLQDETIIAHPIAMKKYNNCLKKE